MPGRRILLRRDDVLVVNGIELDGEVLRAVVRPEARLLWAFVRAENGDVRPVCYTEDEVVWIQSSDLDRTEMPNAV